MINIYTTAYLFNINNRKETKEQPYFLDVKMHFEYTISKQFISHHTTVYMLQYLTYFLNKVRFKTK